MQLIHAFFKGSLTFLFLCIITSLNTLKGGNIEIIISPNKAQWAFYDQYYMLKESIYQAAWHGKITSYSDSNLQHKLSHEDIDLLSRKHERKQFINPKNPDDPYDLIEVDTFEVFNTSMITEISSNGSYVCYTVFADHISQLYLKASDIQKLLSPGEIWLLYKAIETPINDLSISNLAKESFLRMVNKLYSIKSNNQFRIYRSRNLIEPISIAEVEAKGSFVEYNICWKDSNDIQTKQIIRRIDSLNWLSEKGLLPGIPPGQKIHLPFDSNLQKIDTVYTPFNPSTGLTGIRIGFESRHGNQLNREYLFKSIAPCYTPIAGGIELPKPQALFWISSNKSLQILTKEDQFILGILLDYNMESLMNNVVNDQDYY